MPTDLSTYHRRSLDQMRAIQPELEAAFQCTLHFIDKDVDDIQGVMDRNSGVDALAVKPNGKVYALGMRIQYGTWETFTIRYHRSSGNPTEFQKFDADSLALSPSYTVQIYEDRNRIKLGVAKSKELMSYVTAHEFDLEVRTADDEHNTFLVLPWEKIKGEQWFKMTYIER